PDARGAAHPGWRAGGRQEARAGEGRRLAAATRRRPQRARHRTARHDRDPAGHQGGRCDPSRHRGDVMSSVNPLSLGATALNANIAYGANSAALARTKPGTMTNAKARAAAEDFEAVFLNSMFSQMMTHVEGDGPFGGGQGTGVWRSFLVN